MWWPAVPVALPGYRARYDGGWEDELNIRMHCPAHRDIVAAEVVAFLEALRNDLTPAITIETSTW